MQDSYMQQIWRDFDGSVRAVVPLFDNEIRGVDSLRKLAECAFAGNKVHSNAT
jgi:anion-transporting  ArsA/GET3 family ATPase